MKKIQIPTQPESGWGLGANYLAYELGSGKRWWRKGDGPALDRDEWLGYSIFVNTDGTHIFDNTFIPPPGVVLDGPTSMWVTVTNKIVTAAERHAWYPRNFDPEGHPVNPQPHGRSCIAIPMTMTGPNEYKIKEAYIFEAAIYRPMTSPGGKCTLGYKKVPTFLWSWGRNRSATHAFEYLSDPNSIHLVIGFRKASHRFEENQILTQPRTFGGLSGLHILGIEGVKSVECQNPQLAQDLDAGWKKYGNDNLRIEESMSQSYYTVWWDEEQPDSTSIRRTMTLRNPMLHAGRLPSRVYNRQMFPSVGAESYGTARDLTAEPDDNNSAPTTEQLTTTAATPLESMDMDTAVASDSVITDLNQHHSSNPRVPNETDDTTTDEDTLRDLIDKFDKAVRIQAEDWMPSYEQIVRQHLTCMDMLDGQRATHESAQRLVRQIEETELTNIQAYTVDHTMSRTELAERVMRAAGQIARSRKLADSEERGIKMMEELIILGYDRLKEMIRTQPIKGAWESSDTRDPPMSAAVRRLLIAHIEGQSHVWQPLWREMHFDIVMPSYHPDFVREPGLDASTGSETGETDGQ